MTDRDEEERPPDPDTHNSRTPSSGCCGSGTADEAANNDQSESLGEIWFDTMRRNHGGPNQNSTPSSPTNSSADPEGSESSATSNNPPYKKRKFLQHQKQQHNQQQQQNQQNQQNQQQQQRNQQQQQQTSSSSSSGSLHQTDAGASNDANSPRHHHHHHQDSNNENNNTSSRGGYQSDDEGFHLANSSDSSGYFRRGDSCQQKEQLSESDLLAAAGNDDDDKTHKAGDKTTTNQDIHHNKTLVDCSAATASPFQNTQEATAAKKKATQKKRHRLQETTSRGDKNKKRQEDADKDQDDDMNNSKTKKKQKKITKTLGASSSGGDTDTLQQRLERNAREKQRSSKISDQFQSLKDMLALVGVVIPKGTKGSILSLAHQYIVKMKRHDAEQAAANQALQREIESIGQGTMGPMAAQALRAAAQRNGVAMPSCQVPPFALLPPAQTTVATATCFDPLTVVQPQDYPVLWDHSPAGMALATLGGTFIDCNAVFQTMLHFSKAQLREISIFHLIDSQNDKANLQFAFDQILNMLQSIDPNKENATTSGTRPVVLRGSVQGHGHLGMAISLLHASNSMQQQQQPQENGTQRDQHYLCVTLVDKSSMTTSTMDADSHAILRPAHPGMVPTSSLTAQSTLATSIPIVGYVNNMSMMEPAAISAAASTLTTLPTMLMNYQYPQATSSSLSSSSASASSGLFSLAGSNVMLVATPAPSAAMANAVNMVHHDGGGMPLHESASKEQQQQNFGGSDPFYAGTVG
jgi:PAS domain-containing protein